MKNVYYYSADNNYQVELYPTCFKNMTKQVLVTHKLNNKTLLVDTTELDTTELDSDITLIWDGTSWTTSKDGNGITLQQRIKSLESSYNTINLKVSVPNTQSQTNAMFALEISNATKLTNINYMGNILNFTNQSRGTIKITNNPNMTISGFQFQNVSGQLFDITDSSVSLTNITISGGHCDSSSLISYKVVSTAPTFQSHPSSGNPTPTPVSPSMSFKDIKINDIQSDNSVNIIDLTGNKINVKMSGVNIRDNSISGSCIKADNDLSLIDASITFSNNKTSGNGTAIYSVGSLTISGPKTNLKFYDNSTNNSGNGGAIYTIGGLTIQNTIGGSLDFCGNRCGFTGGSIYSSGGVELIDASITFRNNHGDDAGVIYSGKGTINGYGTNLKFYDNSANNNGGAIYHEHGLTLSGSSVDFCGNRCDVTGGAIYTAGPKEVQSEINLIDASITFRNNIGVSGGGAIYNGLNTLTIRGSGTNLKFYDNSAKFGGAIYSNSLTIQNTSGGSVDFCGNQSDESGGAMSTHDFINLIDASIIFSNNISQSGGGGAIYSDNLTISGSGTNLKFYDNSALFGGAISTNNRLTIQHVSGSVDFCGNRSQNKGGAIFSNTDISLIDASITFSNNFGDSGNGGAISSINLTISGSGTNLKFYDNSASNFGGAISTTRLTIQHTSGGSIDFCGNRSSGSGGAIQSYTDISLIDASITFWSNTSANAGGAIYTKNLYISKGSTIDFSKNIVLTPKTFGQAHMATGGGAISAYNNVEISNSTINFYDNSSGDCGGAIIADDVSLIKSTINFTKNSTVWADRNVQSSNPGYGGGAIYAFGTINISGGTVDFSGNDFGSLTAPGVKDGKLRTAGAAIHTTYLYIGRHTNVMFYHNTGHGRIARQWAGQIYMASGDYPGRDCTARLEFQSNDRADLWGDAGNIAYYDCSNISTLQGCFKYKNVHGEKGPNEVWQCGPL